MRGQEGKSEQKQGRGARFFWWRRLQALWVASTFTTAIVAFVAFIFAVKAAHVTEATARRNNEGSLGAFGQSEQNGPLRQNRSVTLLLSMAMVKALICNEAQSDKGRQRRQGAQKRSDGTVVVDLASPVSTKDDEFNMVTRHFDIICNHGLLAGDGGDCHWPERTQSPS